MTALLELSGLDAWYGASQVLRGIDLRIGEGEVVALSGRNGSGRSTLARSIMGLVRSAGERRFAGTSLAGLRPFEIARLGIGYVPEQRDVFPTLTVRENLLLGMKQRHGRFGVDDAQRIFPVLRERDKLMGDPRLLIVDEPAEGLAPQIVRELAACLRDLQARGVAMLLIEQRLQVARSIAARVAVMDKGTIVFDGTPDALDEPGRS